MNVEGKRPTQEEKLKYLEEGIGHVMEIADALGLDMFSLEFELVQPEIMHEFASYAVPGHFSHWSYGRNLKILKTQYEYGMSRIYELVINSDSAYAPLLENNAAITN